MVIMNTVFPLLEKESMPAEVAWGPSGDGGMVWVAGGRGGQKAPAQQRRKVGERRLSYASSFCQLGLTVKGLRVFRVIFSLKREDMLKPILGSTPQIGHLILL